MVTFVPGTMYRYGTSLVIAELFETDPGFRALDLVDTDKYRYKINKKI
jgi:hypothetical protein